MLPLTINMQLLRNRHLMTPQEREEAENFAAWVLRVGNGLTDGDEPGLLRLPEEFCIPPNQEDSVTNSLLQYIQELIRFHSMKIHDANTSKNGLSLLPRMTALTLLMRKFSARSQAMKWFSPVLTVL